ncbi:MAG: hypothetical protein JWN46_1344 [Acidimicrobiales bacterium]|nr:hypothetical protein [Acidimicrobiales bacterium]
MTTLIAHHDVKDVALWLASPKRAEAFGSIGITDVRTFVSPDQPNRVGLLLEVPDLDAFNAAMQSPQFAEAMAHDGVLPETLVILLES